MDPFDAVILAGGRSSRMGGRDKSAESVGDTSLLERAFLAASEADRIVLVGPSRSFESHAIQVAEDPPGGGPVAGIAAALPQLAAERVVVLACDMPFVDAAYVRSLLAALEGDVVCGVDGDGRVQYLPCVFSLGPLLQRLSGTQVHGAPLRSLFEGMDVTLIPDGGIAVDCDTPEELEAARRAVEVRDL